METSSALVITALGGALGALILRSTLKLMGALIARRTKLAVYDCATSEPSKPGNLRHTWGCQVPDSSCRNGKAWEYNSTRIERIGERVTGEHTIYGPYLNDFGRPGFYRVRFRILGKDIPKTDDVVIALDVVQARFGTEQVLRLLGQRVIRARALSGSYQSFDIICYASGTGVYEYRCTVFPEAVAPTKCTIRFDTVTVYSHPPIWEAL
jgi:hypothetical protein